MFYSFYVCADCMLFSLFNGVGGQQIKENYGHNSQNWNILPISRSEHVKCGRDMGIVV